MEKAWVREEREGMGIEEEEREGIEEEESEGKRIVLQTLTLTQTSTLQIRME